MEDAKDMMREIFAGLEFSESQELVQWATEYLKNTPPTTISKDKKLEKLRKKQHQKFENIAKDLKKQGVMVPSNEPEKLSWPKSGFDSDCTEMNTLDIDSFLYDEDDIEEMVEAKQISRSYCAKCGSRSVLPLNFISHSLSRDQIEFMFTKLQPATVSRVVDIGSRIGAVVYGSSIFSNGQNATVGIEMNGELNEITKQTIKKYNLKNVEIVENDLRNEADVLKQAELVVMNNVFSFFLTKSDQENCWEFIKENLREGTILLHHPEIEKATDYLNLSFKIEDWLEEVGEIFDCKIDNWCFWVDTTVECVEFAGQNVEKYEDISTIKKYAVKKSN